MSVFLFAGGALWAGDLQVVSTTPARHTMSAGAGTVIGVRFDRAVDPATVDAASFRAYGRWSGAVSGSFGFSDLNRVVTLTPDHPFSAGETVFVNLSHDLVAADGSPLRGAGYAFQFGIRAAPAERLFDQIDSMSVRGPMGPNPRIYGGLASDVDEDGWLDLTIVNEDSGDLRILLNQADGSGLYDPYLEPTTPVQLGASPNEPADFDNDGHSDVATANVADDSVSILLGNGDATFGPQQRVAVDNVPKGLAVLDADGDGDTDIAVAHLSGDNLALLLNDGSGFFAAPIFFDGGVGGEHGLAAADMNNDGIYDLVVGGRTSQEIRVHLGNGDGTFTAAAPRASGGDVWMLVVGDVNSDGDMDVSTANSATSNGSILLGNGDGTLGPAQTVNATGFATATDLGDLDGDGDLDWILSSFGGGRWRLFSNDGAGTFTFDQEFPAPSNPACAVLLDFDNDGDLDMALLDELADVVLLMRNRDALAIFADGFESGDTAQWSATVVP